MSTLTLPQISSTLNDIADQIISNQSSGNFIGFEARYDMHEKGKLLKNNPFNGHRLTKVTNVNAQVRFDYEKIVERRKGERGETQKSWHCPVIFADKVTPISVHKQDVKLEPVENVHWMELNPVLSGGAPVFVNQNPRLYLRYEILGQGERQESTYLLDGERIENTEVYPYLPKKTPRKDNTAFQLTALKNLSELKIDGKHYQFA